MSQTYQQRRDLVVQVLTSAGIQPKKSADLAEVASAVIDALDSGREVIR